MPQVLGDATCSVVSTLAWYCSPEMQKRCSRWVSNLPLQQGRKWAMSVICGIGTIQVNLSCQASVLDATAPPSVKINCHRIAPRSLAYKARRAKRRYHGGGADDDGPGWDEGGFGGSGGWDGDGGWNGGRGGGHYWGDRWSDDGWWWEEASDAAFNLMYQVACWISLIQCLHFALSKVLLMVQNGIDDSS